MRAIRVWYEWYVSLLTQNTFSTVCKQEELSTVRSKRYANFWSKSLTITTEVQMSFMSLTYCRDKGIVSLSVQQG